MRVSLTVLTLTIIGVASAQDATPITFVCKGARLREAVRLLGEASKVDLQVAEAIGDQEVIAIHVDQVPLNRLMERIAGVVDGRWEQSGARWTLVANETARRAQAAEKRAKRLVAIRKQLSEALAPPKKTEADEFHESAGDRLVYGALATLDLGVIADLESGGRVVFSTNANRMQRSFRLSPQAVEQMVKEHNAEAAASGVDEDPEMQKMQEAMERWGMSRRKKPISEAPAKALLVVETTGLGFMDPSGISMSLRLYSASGKTLATRSAMLYADGDPYSVPTEPVKSGELEKSDKEPQKVDPGPKIEWEVVLKEIQERTTGGMFGAGPSKPWSDRAKEILSQPEVIDPLQIFIGDGLIQVAKWKQWDLVASLSDDAMETLGESPPTNCGTLLARLEKGDGLSAKLVGKEWTIRPRDPAQARSKRADRFIIAKMVKKSFAGQRLGLDDLAELALKSPRPMESPLAAIYLFTFNPWIIQYAMMPRSWDYLRLWGTLTSPQRAAPSTRINLGGLTPVQSSIVNSLVFGAQPSLEVGAPSADMEALGSFGRMMTLGIGEYGGKETSDFREEPTELLPNGLPSMGFLQVSTTDDVALRPVASGPGSEWMSFMGNMGIEDLALFQHMSEKAGSANEFMPRVDRVVVGRRRNIELAIHVAEGVRLSHRLSDDAFDPDAKPMGVDAVPDEVKQRVAKAIEKIKSLNLPFLDPSSFGRPPIPPPLRS